MLHPLLVHALVYPSITSNLVTLATLSPNSDSVYTHLLSLHEETPLEVNQDGCYRVTNELVTSFN